MSVQMHVSELSAGILLALNFNVLLNASILFSKLTYIVQFRLYEALFTFWSGALGQGFEA